MRQTRRLRRDGPVANLEVAFDLPLREIEDMWREYLRDLARPQAELTTLPSPEELLGPVDLEP